MDRWRMKKRTWWAMVLGQAVSFTVALAGFNSSLLVSLGVDAPVAQGCFSYFSLALIYGSILLHRRHTLLVSWYWYLLLGFLDVQANFLLNKAYQFSSITSITLLVCWSIPWVIILTWLVLGTRYSILQLVGSALCVLGLVLVILSDAWTDSGGGSSMPLLGDALVIGATIFFALANVGEEFIVKDGGQIEMEMLSMINVFGLLCSLVELAVFELKGLESLNWSIDMIWAIIGYTLSVFCQSSIGLYVLKLSGATMLNLSCLSSNMWAVVIRTIFYHQKVDWLYFLAFAVVILGLVIYSTNEKAPVPDHDSDGVKSSSSECEGLLVDENGEAVAGHAGSVP